MRFTQQKGASICLYVVKHNLRTWFLRFVSGMCQEWLPGSMLSHKEESKINELWNIWLLNLWDGISRLPRWFTSTRTSDPILFVVGNGMFPPTFCLNLFYLIDRGYIARYILYPFIIRFCFSDEVWGVTSVPANAIWCGNAIRRSMPFLGKA